MGGGGNQGHMCVSHWVVLSIRMIMLECVFSSFAPMGRARACELSSMWEPTHAFLLHVYFTNTRVRGRRSEAGALPRQKKGTRHALASLTRACARIDAT